MKWELAEDVTLEQFTSYDNPPEGVVRISGTMDKDRGTSAEGLWWRLVHSKHITERILLGDFVATVMFDEVVTKVVIPIWVFDEVGEDES